MMTKSASVRTIKKALSLAFLVGILIFSFVFSTSFAVAQTDDHTAAAEAEGKKVWDALQSKEKTCASLTDDEFEFLGEYYMGQMFTPYRTEGSGMWTGSSHAAMNEMMVSMMGEAGEEQMHAVMGKRLSGCDTAAAYPSNGVGFMSMMGMMNMMSGRYGGGNWSNFMNFSDTNNMMSFGPSFLFLGWIFAILWHVLIIVGIIVLIKWLFGKMGSGGSSSLNILKERYAKGEITKHEFEEKKKELM